MKREKKQVASKVKKVKFDLSSTPDAIVDGKFIVSIGDKVIVQRIRNERKHTSICIFKGVDASGGVTMWDETVSQFFSFNLSEPPLVKLLGDIPLD